MNRKQISRAVSIVLALVMLASVLVITACTQPAPSTSPAPAPASKPAPAPAPVQAKAEAIKWKGQNYYNPGLTIGQIADAGGGISGYRWRDWVNKATQGRLTVDWSPPGSMFPVADSLAAVSKGVVPVALCYPGAYEGTMPEGGPEGAVMFAADNIADAYVALYDYGVYETMKKLYAERNIYLLGIFPTTSTANLRGNFDMSSPEKFKGKKIRAVGTSADYASLIGATVVPMPLNDVYMALKLGTVDGTSCGVMDLEQSKFKEVVKYALLPGISVNNSNILINMDAWKALPADIREMLDRDSRGIFYLGAMELNAVEHYIQAQLKEVTFQQWSPADRAKVIKQAIETQWPKVASRSPGCNTIIEMYKKFAKDFGKY